MNCDKKGNSLFSELEDNRQAIEKHLISLKSKYETLKMQVNVKNHQISNLKVGELLFDI